MCVWKLGYACLDQFVEVGLSNRHKPGRSERGKRNGKAIKGPMGKA